MPKNTYSFTIEKSHPCFPGHFPGNPVVPGAMILEQVLLAWNQSFKHKLIAFEFSKFVNPLLAETSCTINFTLLESNKIKTNTQISLPNKLKADFNVMANSLLICKGRIIYA